MQLQEMFNLKGKVALVTGGGRGIGKHMATGLAEAGADVVLASRNLNNLEEAAAELSATYGIRAIPIACDVSKEEKIAALVDDTLAKMGRIDILVNNAGVTWGAPTLEFPLEQWDKIFNTNVRGVWMLSQRVARTMKEQGGGVIINVSSIMGFRGSEEEWHPSVPYNSAKAAINLLTMNLAVKLAPHKIRVNAVAPGFFRTDMMAFVEKPGMENVHKMMVRAIPLKRSAGVDDMKGVAVFLSSDASAYVTGQILGVDGGLLAK